MRWLTLIPRALWARAHRWLGAPILALLLLSPLSPALASAHGATLRLAATKQASGGHVTILILDMSGSMAQNDPNGLRCSAANAYVDLSGAGDYVGVIGLAGSGSGGPNGFGSAEVWAQPAEMATVASRTALRQTIAQRSQNCQPNAATPTYDALRQALAMLKTATAQSGLSGSVILLTDGAPFPQPDAQIAAIQRDLLPQFKQSGFPIDAIGLGADQTLHTFLSGLADATGGSYFDDGHGVVPGVSALNIAPFFVSVFALRNGRVASNDIPPTQLSGGAVSRNFSVGDFVSQLSVVAVKDSPGATVTLTAPNGQIVSSSTAGILYSEDLHYVIFSIPNPQQGAWQLNAHGSGEFLMDSLKVSTLALSIITPSAQSSVAPLGQPLTIAAQLENGGVAITGTRYSLTGSLAYAGGDGQYRQDFTLDDSASPGTYKAQVVAPANAPPGAYTITIVAREISDTIASATRSLRIERFPTPVLLSPTTHQPVVTGAVTAQVTLWDPALRLIYGAPVGLIQWLSQWPLQGTSAQSTAAIQGQVYLDGKPYSHATVSGAVTRAGARASAPLTVIQGDNGAFTATFPAATSGVYTLTLDTQGSFQDSHGDLGVVTRPAQVTLVNATLAQEGRAWGITALYIAVLALLFLLARYWLSPRPFGRLVSSDGGGEEFARARRGLYALWQPSIVRSQQMGLEPGLRFRFARGGRILARGVGAEAREFRLGGDPLPLHEVSATESTLSTRDGELSYIVSASGADDEEEDEGYGRRRNLFSRRSRSEDDVDELDDGPRLGFARFGRRRAEEDDDEDDFRPARRSRVRSRVADDDEDDFRSSRTARSRSRARDDDDDDMEASRTRRRRSARSRNADEDDW